MINSTWGLCPPSHEGTSEGEGSWLSSCILNCVTWPEPSVGITHVPKACAMWQHFCGVFRSKAACWTHASSQKIPEFWNLPWRGWMGSRECSKMLLEKWNQCVSVAPLGTCYMGNSKRRVTYFCISPRALKLFWTLKEAILKHFHVLQNSWSDTEDTEK